MAANYWISLEVKSCSTLLPSTAVAVTSEDTFGSVLEKVYDSPEAQVEKVTIGDGSQNHFVPMDAPVMKVSRNHCPVERSLKTRTLFQTHTSVCVFRYVSSFPAHL